MSEEPGRRAVHRPSLRFRIFALLVGLVVVTTAGAGFTLWYTGQTQRLLDYMMERDISALLAAQGLESSLVMQKGYATYYFLSRDPSWLEKLETHNQKFQEWLDRARESSYLDRSRGVLNRIESAYLQYAHYRDEVLALYKAGRSEEGRKLHWEVRQQFLDLYDLCEQYKRLHEEKMLRDSKAFQNKGRMVTWMAWIAAPASVVLGLLLAWVLLKQVLEPIRRLAAGDVRLGVGPVGLRDEVQALQSRMHGLMEDMDQTHSQLKESQEHLKQTEKLALVGKLAAGVAHSIRNPLTSVKMRLFSLERSLDLDAIQKEDFEVISEEIRHLDTIIRNFLEFSRPPKLKTQRVSPSEVVDMTLQLLHHRLDSAGVEVRILRKTPLPAMEIDPERLKEALINIVMNACDAMTAGGELRIAEEMGIMEPQGEVAMLRISDSGPGIPDEISDEVFQPFFSTKEEGTGLGLAIAKRIMEEHGGWLHLTRSEGGGATFVLVIPTKEKLRWVRS
jgi:signal transduction histidine kinase